MNPAVVFGLVAAAYLAVVAYGVVGTRKRGLPPRFRLIASAAQVVLPPAILFVILFATADAFAIGGWGILLVMLMIAGALLALCTDLVARRVL
ncbi:hypothetical protein [Sphingomonas montanisoli]|uniref:Uncharacterized protein n=1 Tax=Sphingomonas montanisoli TaxID=2606412 RepID=A0A5D9C720_9SPHN|nr:hypothetical protein [Sphingomonas montanisoli]TZG27479.1 hypothetical protein FYJ91_07765 [Sphingomonas montanisoli]